MVRQEEGKLVNEWLQQFYPNSLQWKKVRLGSLPDVALAKMYTSALRWADAIVVEDGKVLIIEAKLERQIAAISQLEIYSRLFRETPEFSAYRSYPIRQILVVPYIESDVKAMCAEKNIEYIVFTPVWFSRYP